jgi:hypothetical protein
MFSAAMATPEQLRDSMPFAALVGAELTEASRERVRATSRRPRTDTP